MMYPCAMCGRDVPAEEVSKVFTDGSGKTYRCITCSPPFVVILPDGTIFGQSALVPVIRPASAPAQEADDE